VKEKQQIRLTTGYRTALADGTLVPDSPFHMATERFYHALPGSRLQLNPASHLRGKYLYAVAVFGLDRNPGYIYEYAYQREENWTTYTQNLTSQSYGAEEYVFEAECYFRVCVRRADGGEMSEEDSSRSAEIVEYFHEEPERTVKPCFAEEVKKTVEVIRRMEQRCPLLKLCLLSDTHYTVNGTWEDTAANIKAVSEQVEYDGIVHLGDMTDGMLSKELTKEYVGRMLADLDACGVPVYVVPGNHDTNYFYNEPNTFSAEEMRAVYRLPEAEMSQVPEFMQWNGIDYYVDFERFPVRMIVLNSFDNKAPVRYGYSEEQLAWLRSVLFGAAPGTKFLIFSHDAPLAKLDYWSFLIRNGEALLDILEECNAREEYQILGFFYGHVHTDAGFDECSFPVLSVGCAKLEYFLDKKPECSVTPYREADTVSQDLWDSLLIDFEKQKLTLVRFGAGEDREFSYRKKEATYKKVFREQRKNRKTKVWAHRGASGYAPENTMPAFRLAWELGADGIELDVQLTKDGVPVVIHDETVNRTTDGTGYVKDFTLEELKKLNANKQFPNYGRVEISTLAEVYEFISGTDMTVNVELKTNVFSYPGIEEKLLELAADVRRNAGEEAKTEAKGGFGALYEEPFCDRIVYSSFNHYSVKKIKELAPDAKIAFLYTDGFMNVAKYADIYNGYAVHPSVRGVRNTPVVEEAHAKGIRVHVWTVNEEADKEEMTRLGVDAIITNYP